jgi:hypothetical protein
MNLFTGLKLTAMNIAAKQLGHLLHIEEVSGSNLSQEVNYPD